MKPNPEKLECVSIIIADAVYRDERTKNLVIAGTFNTISVPALPWPFDRLTVLFSITNGKGEYQLVLRIEHEVSGTTVAELSGPFRLESPLTIQEVNVEFRGLKFAAFGKYWVTILADGAIVAQRPLWVAPMEEKGGGGS